MSLFSRALRSQNLRCPQRAVSILSARRCLHSSTTLFKAKNKGDDDEFDPFVEDDDGQDALFDMETTTEQSHSAVAKPPTPNNTRGPLILADTRFPDEHIERIRRKWEALHAELTGHLSRESSAQERAAIPIKAFRRLINDAQSQEEWQKTADIVELWRTALGRSHLKIERLLGRYYYMLKRQAKAAAVQDYETKHYTPPSALVDIEDMFRSEPSSADSSTGVDLLTPEERGLAENYIEDYTKPLGRRRALWAALREQLRTRLITDKKKDMAPRKSMLRLICLSQTQEDLREATDLLSVWRQNKGLIDAEITEQFLGRCVSLKMPQFAVEILANRPKYGVDLPTQYRAHTILHGLLQQIRPGDPDGVVQSAFTLASLMSSVTFPHILQDETSALLLIALCYQADTDDARVKGAEVLDDLKAWREAERRGLTPEEKILYQKEGFVLPMRKRPLTAAEKTWRQNSLQTVLQFSESIGVETDVLVPEARPIVATQ